MYDDCEHCNLDRVRWSDVLSCTYKSCAGICRDIMHEQREDIIGVLTRDDRILYVIGLVLVALTMQLVFAR